MSKFLKKDQISSSWYEIDAQNAVVGRLATIISKIIRGKNKTTYTPHMDDGDFVVVKNIEKAKFTGKKFQNKKYYRHTGHPGGIKETTPEKLMSKKPGEVLKLAVKAHHALGCRGVTRTDFKFFNNRFYILEINTQPGMTNLSLVPEIANYKGINFPNLIEKILQDASINK